MGMFELQYITGILMGFISKDDVFSVVSLLIILLTSLILPWIFLSKAHAINKNRYYVKFLSIIKIGDIYSGQFYIKGDIKNDIPIRSYLTDTPCIWCSYYVLEQWRRSIKIRRVDKNGKEHVKRKVIFGWSPLYADEYSCPFYLHDESGKILVDPSGANMEPVTSLYTECGISDPLFFEKGPDGIIPYSTRKRKFVEKIIPVTQPLHIFGVAKKEEIGNPSIIEKNGDDHYHISTRSKTYFLKKSGYSFWSFQITGLLISSIPLIVMLFPHERPRYSFQTYTFSTSLIIIFTFFSVFLWQTLIVKNIRNSRKRTQGMWKTLESLFKEKQAIIPELYKIASYYSIFNHLSQDELLELEHRIESDDMTFDQLLNKHPKLGKGKIFLPLNNRLKQIELEIKQAKKSYNSLASVYNHNISILSAKIIKMFYSFKPMPKSSDINMEKFKPIISHHTEPHDFV